MKTSLLFEAQVGLTCLLGILGSTGRRIEFDFEKSLYFITGADGISGTVGGRLADIRCLSLSRNVGQTDFAVVANVEFHKEANRQPFRINDLACSLRTKVINEQVLLYLALATRLNVQVLNRSGWNASYPPAAKPAEIVISPGETHPALLQPPSPQKMEEVVKQNVAVVEKITFGVTATTRRNILSAVLAAFVFFGFVYQYAGSFFAPIFLIMALAILGNLIRLTNRNTIEINFQQEMHYLEIGSWPDIKVTGGRLSEISHIAITRVLQSGIISYAAYIVFYPEIKRTPYRLDLMTCSARANNFVDRFALYLELAARLNVPVYDDSGWNGSRSKFSEPKLIVVQPGETHPALLHAPTKWKKW